MAQVHADGEHLFGVLVDEITASGFKSKDDNLKTTGGTIQAAILVIGRMRDELNARAGEPVTVTAHTLAVSIKSRLKERGYTRKRADDMALELWLGATMLAEVMGNKTLQNYLARLAVCLLATRGARWLDEFIHGDGK